MTLSLWRFDGISTAISPRDREGRQYFTTGELLHYSFEFDYKMQFVDRLSFQSHHRLL
jgi:hypothetical protein